MESSSGVLIEQEEEEARNRWRGRLYSLFVNSNEHPVWSVIDSLAIVLRQQEKRIEALEKLLVQERHLNVCKAFIS